MEVNQFYSQLGNTGLLNGLGGVIIGSTVGLAISTVGYYAMEGTTQYFTEDKRRLFERKWGGELAAIGMSLPLAFYLACIDSTPFGSAVKLGALAINAFTSIIPNTSDTARTLLARVISVVISGIATLVALAYLTPLGAWVVGSITAYMIAGSGHFLQARLIAGAIVGTLAGLSTNPVVGILIGSSFAWIMRSQKAPEPVYSIESR